MTPDAAILAALHHASGGFVAPGELQRVVAEDRASLPRRIRELERLGYDIEVHPHHGYRLLHAPDRLTADAIRAQFEPRIIGREILVFEETTSTNDIAERLAATQPGEGLVVFAESQTRGRGRHGRVWASPRGKGLWFSVVLRPAFPVGAFTRLTVMASVAVVRALRQTGLVDARIKWPNDIVVQGCKLAGILTEPRGGAAVLGIGIDVNCGLEDFPPNLRATATSVALAAGRPCDRTALAAAVLSELDGQYARVADAFESVGDEWAGLSVTLGKRLAVKIGERRVEGLAHALDGDGALLLRKDNGHVERITGGDLVEAG